MQAGSWSALFSVLLAIAAACVLLLASDTAWSRTPAPLPGTLQATGLYADFPSRTVAKGVLPYTPQYPLWSDGAEKHRWIRLPRGKAIDARDPDHWVFPAGTRLWKQFSFGGRPVETRLMEAVGPGTWRYATYAWAADGSTATRVPDDGAPGAAEIRPGVRHDIPSVTDCAACHRGEKRDEALGFSALQLSTDRDPNAPHAEPVAPGAVDLGSLVERRLVRGLPRDPSARAPRIDAPDATSRAALGYLHANCGSCHHAGGSLDSQGVFLRQFVAPEARARAAGDSPVDRQGSWDIPGLAAGSTWLVRAGDPDHSSVLARMETRIPSRQMPPLATKLVDEDAARLVRAWILQTQSKEAP